MNGGGGVEAANARNDEILRQQEVRKGTKRIDEIFSREFGDQFYTGRRKAALDYFNPQLQDQYGKARNNLVYDLARNGTLSSSIRAARFGDLDRLYATNQQDIRDKALASENQARTSIEDARANLIQTLNATGDSQGVVNSALNRASVLSKPDAYSPLADMFGSFTGLLGQQAAQERAEALSGGAYKARYNTGLFGNTGRVTVG